MIRLNNALNRVNILHWSSIKYKRMIRSVLTFELYDINHEFDMKTMLKTTIKKMLQFNIALVICTDFRFLYECLVKLKTTYEKWLMIDVMNLCQSYERREIIKIRWIDKNNNPIDSMTKTKTFSTLKTLIDSNRINLNAIK